MFNSRMHVRHSKGLPELRLLFVILGPALHSRRDRPRSRAPEKCRRSPTQRRPLLTRPSNLSFGISAPVPLPQRRSAELVSRWAKQALQHKKRPPSSEQWNQDAANALLAHLAEG